jgi:hypothetical protein
MKFKTGDKVWVKCEAKNLQGIKAGIIDGPSQDGNMLHPSDGPWYEVLILGSPSSHPSGLWAGRERNIWPRDEDGRQPGSWYDSIYNPLKEKVS